MGHISSLLESILPPRTLSLCALESEHDSWVELKIGTSTLFVDRPFWSEHPGSGSAERQYLKTGKSRILFQGEVATFVGVSHVLQILKAHIDH